MTDTANRIMWVFIGLLLSAIGAFGIVVHLGRLPGLPADTAVLGPQLLSLWRRGDPWNLAVPVVGGLLLVLAGLWLFGRQFRRRGAASMTELVVGDATADTGKTRVRPGGLVHALERDISGSAAVRRCQVKLTGRAPNPDAWVRLDLVPHARLSDVREHLDRCLDRFDTTSGVRPKRLDVTVAPSAKERDRVR